MTMSDSDNRIAGLFQEHDKAGPRPPRPPAKSQRRAARKTGTTSNEPPAPEVDKPFASSDPVQWPLYLSIIYVANRSDGEWVREAEEFLPRVERLLARLRDCEPLEWPMPDAARFASLIAQYVKNIAVDVVPTEDDVPESEQNDFEREEWRQLREHWEQMRPAQKKLGDEVRVSAVLTGQMKAGPAEARGLLAVLNKLADRTRWWLRDYRERQERLRRLYEREPWRLPSREPRAKYSD
jgi:hypothetical protein